MWNINSVESVAYEYSRYNNNATNFYDPGPYRSSDHDPTLVGFTIAQAQTQAKVDITAKVVPKKLGAGRLGRVKVSVKSDGHKVPDGRVRLRESGKLLSAGTIQKGKVQLPFRFQKAGTYTLRVVYLGTDEFAKDSTLVTVRVR